MEKIDHDKKSGRLSVEKSAAEKTPADKIWDSIKDLKLEIFALPDQFVSSYCEPIPIEPSKLYLKYKAPAVLPSLEVAVQGTYTVELMDRYIVVTPVVKKV